MKKEEMVALLGSAGVPPSTIDAMTQAYEMGFEQGASVYKQLSDVIEDGVDVCKAVDADDMKTAKWHAKYFWDALGKVREQE